MAVDRPFTTLMVSNQNASLLTLRNMLVESDGVRDRNEFRDMMVAAFGFGGLELRALSDDLGFSFSSVFRWQEGKSAPHPAIWPTVMNWVKAAVAKQVEVNEKLLAALK